MRYAVIVVGLMLALSGCGTADEKDPTNVRSTNVNTVQESIVKLRDGRSVVCLTWKMGYGGGMSCDWSQAR